RAGISTAPWSMLSFPSCRFFPWGPASSSSKTVNTANTPDFRAWWRVAGRIIPKSPYCWSSSTGRRRKSNPGRSTCNRRMDSGSSSRGFTDGFPEPLFTIFSRGKNGPAAMESSPTALPKAVEAYLDHVRDVRGYSRHTLSAYSRDLEKLAAWCAKKGPAAAAVLDRKTLQLFLSAQARSLAAGSQSRLLACLKGFGKFLVAHHGLERNPAASIAFPKRESKLFTVASESFLDEVLAEEPDSFTQARTRLCVE